MTFYAECKETTVTSRSTVLEATNCQPKGIKSIVKKEVVRKYKHEVEQHPCVGHFTVKQWKNEDFDKRWCNISKVWKSIPSVVYSMYTGIPSMFYKQRSIKLRSDSSVTVLMRTLLCSNPITLHIKA